MHETNETLIKNLYACISRKDWTGYAALISAQVVYHAAGSNFMSGTVRGKEDFLKLTQLAEQAEHEVFKVELLSVQSNPHFISAHDRWTVAKDGSPVTIENLVIFKVRDGLVTEIWEFVGL